MKIWWLLLSTATKRMMLLIGVITTSLLVALGTVSGITKLESRQSDSTKLRLQLISSSEVVDRSRATNSVIALKQNDISFAGDTTEQILVEPISTDAIDDELSSRIKTSTIDNVLKSNETAERTLKSKDVDAHTDVAASDELMGIPALTISKMEVKRTSSNVEKTDSKPILMAQVESTEGNASATLQFKLQNLVDQALSGEKAEEEPVPAPEPKPKDAAETTGDLLKSLVGQASEVQVESDTEGSYISKLNAEVEVTVVISEEEAQKPAAAKITESDRIKMIQDIASKIADDSEETIQSVEYLTVEENDSLWLIAERIYGDPHKYKLLYSKNKDLLTDEDSLIVGQKIRIPRLDDN